MDNANEQAVQYRRRDVLRVCSSYHYQTPRAKRLAVIARIADAHGVAVSDIIGERRLKHIAAARKAAMQAVFDAFPGDSTPEIGRLFNRDHTTVLAALGRIAKRRKIVVDNYGGTAPVIVASI